MPFQCVVRNFLAAKEVKFTIRGFTILKGESSSGKSSSLKALYAACTNTFSPSQVRWHTDAATIKIRFKDNEPILTVVRTRKGSPTMQFNGKEYSKIARSVPKEIEDYLNIGFIQVGNEKYCLNFFTQFQPPLLHVFSQRRIAEILSSSSALDDYNAVTKAIANRREQLKGSFNSIDTLMTEIKERIQPNKIRIEKEKPLQSALTEVYKEYLSAESAGVQIKALVEQSIYFSRKSLLISQRRRLKDVYVELEQSYDCIESLNTLKDSIFRYARLSMKLMLSKILKDQLAALQKLCAIKDFLEGAKSATVRISEIRKKHQKSNIKIALYQQAESLMDEQSAISNERYLFKEFQLKVSRLKDLKERIEFNKQMVQEDVCPFCGSKTNGDMNKAEIIEKRKALEEQILADEKEVSVLESKIKEGSEKLGIKDDVASIEAALQEKTALLQQKEKEVNTILEKIEDLEREKPVELSETVLPEAPTPKVITPTPTTSVKVEKPIPETRTDILDGEDELE